MKAWMACAALLGLAACIENPGVDAGLATKHDRAQTVYHLPADGMLRVRLERIDGETRLYLANSGKAPVDSFGYLIQIGLYPFQPPFGFPYNPSAYFEDDPFFEARGSLPGLDAGEEADLGRLDTLFPRELDKVHIRLIPFFRNPGGSPPGSASSGFYLGRYETRTDSAVLDSGTVRGLIVFPNHFFWLRHEARSPGFFWGWMRNDTLDEANYRPNRNGYEYWRSAPVPLYPPMRGDSLRFRLAFPNGASQTGKWTYLEVRMLRTQAPRWQFGNGDPRSDPDIIRIPLDPPETIPYP